MLSEKSQWTQNSTMFVDLYWPLNASSLLSASAELLVYTLCQDPKGQWRQWQRKIHVGWNFDFWLESLFTSETARYIYISQEVLCAISICVSSDDLEWPLTGVSSISGKLNITKKLMDKVAIEHYGKHKQSIEWYQLQRPWFTLDRDFSVAIFFDIKYLIKSTT